MTEKVDPQGPLRFDHGIKVLDRTDKLGHDHGEEKRGDKENTEHCKKDAEQGDDAFFRRLFHAGQQFFKPLYGYIQHKRNGAADEKGQKDATDVKKKTPNDIQMIQPDKQDDAEGNKKQNLLCFVVVHMHFPFN